MEIKRRMHNGYKEFKEANKQGIKINQYFGAYQYLYSLDGCEISLVRLKDPFRNVWFWEIYCLQGDLFEGSERFATKGKAEIRIKEIYNERKK